MKSRHRLPMTHGQGWGGDCSAQRSPPQSWALSQRPQLRKPLLTLPGTGLLDQALPLRLVGHLDEPVLIALGQHLLHGG